MSTFNEWLRVRLRERNLTQRQLAYLSGVNHSTISRLARSDRTPSLKTAAKLIRAFGSEIPSELVDLDESFAVVGGLEEEVERALRRDSLLSLRQVQMIMDYYQQMRAFTASGRITPVVPIVR
jgi:transcriptional regulator with XRE-family HTH domain